MKTKIKLSIIIPIYGVENYISRLLESLLPQLNKQVECICINDGTKDKSFEILKEHLTKYPDNHYLNKKYFLSLSRTDYLSKNKNIIFYLLKKCIKTVLKFLKNILNIKIKNYRVEISHIFNKKT